MKLLAVQYAYHISLLNSILECSMLIILKYCKTLCTGLKNGVNDVVMFRIQSPRCHLTAANFICNVYAKKGRRVIFYKIESFIFTVLIIE